MAETRGKADCHSIPGGSGEVGCFQYLESTWELYSKIVLGYVAPRTKINERYVTVHMVERWLRKGYTAYEIALIWNSGSTLEIKGVNEHGEAYDTVAYAQTVLAYLHQ